MKRRILTFIFGLITMFCFMACHSDDLSGSAAYELQQKQTEYREQFQKAFGEVAPNHDWGFGLVGQSASKTRAHDVNGNLWYQNWVRPVNVTEAEAAKVVEEFSKKRENAVNTIEVNWDNYWVQQVYQSQQHYNDGFGQDIGEVCGHMNKIIAYNEVGTTTTIWPEWNHWQATEVTEHYEHVNNFNYGTNTTVYTDDITGQKYYGTTLMKDMGVTPSGTPKFGYHNTTDSKDHFEYIILEIDGAYYVGFDFCASHPEGQDANKNMDVNRDWVFNDWIVKISPAIHDENIEYEARIICEDLGAIGDWDFNDVVFDALIKDGKTYIKLLAAGGTMPLTVAGQEVHNLFNVDVTDMVNTGIISADPVEFSVDNAYSSYADIPIMVQAKGAAGEFITYELKMTIGDAPQKICVGTDYEWCSERQNIENKYPKFKNYVGNPSIGHDWYK